MTCSLVIVENPQAVAIAAAQRIISVLHAAIERSGVARLALAGGRTPRELYALLTHTTYRHALPWNRIEWFWGDERCVPPDHPESNYRLVAETLLSVLSPPPQQVHRMLTERNPDEAAALYEATIRSVFSLAPDEIPRFDLVLLGMGTDCHIASLFPHTRALSEERRLVVSNWVPRLAERRLTLTPRVLQAAQTILILVTGSEKAEAVRRALTEPTNIDDCPAHLLRLARGDVVWLLNSAAASQTTASSGPCPPVP